MDKKIHVVIGSSGGIGQQFVKELAQNTSNIIFAFSRTKKVFNLENVIEHNIDITSEESIKNAAQLLAGEAKISQVIITTGILHNDNIKPEKCIGDIQLSSLEKVFAINAFAPILIAKHFLPLMERNDKSIFAAISARVSSISDNRLGGWYAYRASKSALNMFLKTLSIEAKRRNPNLIIAGLHPGTVDTSLSKPFQNNVPKGKLFTTEYSVKSMLEVLNNLNPESSGNLYDYAGKIIQP